MMKTSITSFAAFFLVGIFVSSTSADVITGGSVGGLAVKYTYRTVDAKGKEVYKSNTAWGQGLRTDIESVGSDTYATCVDLLTTFKTGTEYNAYNLFDDSVSFITDQQKQDIATLYSYTYATLDTGKLTWDKKHSYDQINVAAFQLAVWEILMENPANTGYSLADGWFATTGPSTVNDANTAKYGSIFELSNSWLAAVSDSTGALWSDMGYQAVSYDYTVWIPEDGKSFSQALVTVAPATTPEPASMLIVGFGLAGFALLRRRSSRLGE